MQKFIIGIDNFGVGKVTCKIDKNSLIISDLTITGDQDTYDKLSSGEESNWNWTLYPPELYLRGISYQLQDEKIHIEISRDTPLDEVEVALYLMEHNYLEGKFMIDENRTLSFDGIADIFGEEMKVQLRVNLDIEFY
ncbi:MAG: hypothetical protein V4722_11495 [Bacteroidota bacterium]